MQSQERDILGQHDERTVGREESEAVIELRQEELAARKHQVETGRVSLGTDVVEEERTLEVPVTREEVTIERHPVDRRPSDAPISATSEVLTVPVREERVAVDKQAVVYEEVTVGKRAVEDTRRVSEMVRKEVADVDATGTAEVSGRSSSGPSLRKDESALEDSEA